MKKSFSKRLLAVFLAAVMVVTAVPMAVFAANKANSAGGGYLMAYFKDNSDRQKLYFSMSKDGYTFEELNGDQEIPLDYSNTQSNHIRDPFIFKAQNDDANGYKYYIIATDMDANNWGAQDRQHAANLWGTKDIAGEWEHVSNIDMDSRTDGSLGKLMSDTYGDKVCHHFWAPEVIWDDNYTRPDGGKGAYMVTFGFSFQDWSRGTRLYYAHTLDFAAYYDVGALLEPTRDGSTILDCIDSDLQCVNGTWYMLFKLESDIYHNATNDTPCTDERCQQSRVFVTRSKTDSPTGPYYSNLETEKDYVYQISRGKTPYEGPLSYKIEGTDTYVVGLDDFTNKTVLGKYTLYQTGDFNAFEPIPETDYVINYENEGRHASVVHISDQEYDDLILKYGKFTKSQTGIASGDINDHLVGRYFVDSNPILDASGNGNDIVNGVNGEFANMDGKTKVVNGKLCVDFSGNAVNVTPASPDGKANPPTSNNVPEQFNRSGDPPWFNKAFLGIASSTRTLYSRNLGTYFSVYTADLLKNTNLNQGVSISFDALASLDGLNQSSDSHVIDISNAKEFGYINKSGEGLGYNGSATRKISKADYELSSNPAAFNNAADLYVQMDAANKATVRTLKDHSEGTHEFNTKVTEWHNYTITVTKGLISVYVDGNLSIQVKNTAVDEKWFNDLFKSSSVNNNTLTGKSKLGVGASHWLADYLFDGYVADLCIYDRCLSFNDIQEAKEDLTEGEKISLSESKLIYQDLVTDEQFGKYTDVISGDATNGYGNMLQINGKTIDSAERVTDSETTVSPTGYSYNFWVNPGDANDNGILMRHGSDQYHFDIKENGMVEFRYGDNISFTSDSLFELTPNKVQNVTIEVIPFASYDRILAYVDGEFTGYYDAYLAAEYNNYPDKTLLSFINDTNSSTNSNYNVRYGDASTNTVVKGVTIHRGAVDARELYIDKFSQLAETLYKAEFEEFEAKIKAFDTSDHLYKNMYNAYVLYDKVNRYLDAVQYGKNDPDMEYFSQLITDFKLANDEMVPYSGKSAINTMDVQYSNSNGTYTTSGYSKGVFYTTPVTNESGLFNNVYLLNGNPNLAKDGCQANVLYNETVFVYDGTQEHLSMPIWLNIFRNDNSDKKRYISSAYPCPPGDYDPYNYPEPDAGTTGYPAGYDSNPASSVNPVFSLKKDGKNNTGWIWHGNTIGATTGDQEEIGYDLFNTVNNQNDKRSLTTNTKGTNHYWINCLDIDTSKLADYADIYGNTGSISGEYRLKWHVYGCNPDGLNSNQWFYRKYKDNSIFGFGGYDYYINRPDDSVIFDQQNKIYILDLTDLDATNKNCPINQKNPTDAVKRIVKNDDSQFVLSYELSADLLKAIDMYTSFDKMLEVEKGKNNSPSVLYSNLSRDINNAASDYNNAYDEAMKSFSSYNAYKDTDYDNLKAQIKDDAYLEKIDNIKTNHTIDGSEKFTTDSCEAYIDVYENAVNHFKSLDPRNEDGGQAYATEDGNTSDTATNLYNDILEADSKLMPVADYDKITKDYNDSMALSLGDPVGDGNTVNQIYSVKSWLGLAEPQQAAAEYVNADPAVKNNTPKYAALENGVVDRTSPSAIQLEIAEADDTLMAAVDALAAPATGDVLETYNAAQRLAERVDLDAYVQDAKQPILDNFKLGYYSADNTIKNAQAPAEGSVYVSYNGGNYIYGGDTETENATKTVLEALNVTFVAESGKPVKVGEYKVTVNVFIDGVESSDAIDIKTHLYGSDTGSQVRIDVSQSFDANVYDVAKWTVQSQIDKHSDKYSGETLINETGFAIDRTIQQNTIVNLYLTNKIADAAKVVVTNCFGVQLDTAYVSGDFAMTSAETDAKLVFTDAAGRTHEVDATEAYGFTFTKWDVIKSADGTIRVVQRAEKVNNEQYALYKVEGGTINGNDGTAGVYANFNEYVTFVSTADNFFAWVKSLNGTDWYVASYDANFRTISAPTDAKGITYKAVTADEFAALGINNEIANDALSVNAPFSFGTATKMVNVNDVNKFRLYCDYTVNSNMNKNVQVVQYGVLYTAGDTEPENFIKGADGIKAAAANACSDCNTYTMTLSPKPGATTYMRSYVSYMYTTKDKDGNDVKVPLVAYGPVVSCDANGNISR